MKNKNKQLSFSFVKKDIKKSMSSQTCIKQIVGDIKKGEPRVGFTGGQFSLSDKET